MYYLQNAAEILESVVIWRPVNGLDDTHRVVRLTSSEQAPGQVLRFAPAIRFQQKAGSDDLDRQRRSAVKVSREV